VAGRRVARRQLRFPVEKGFDLHLTLHGHGWVDLAPFHWDDANAEMSTVLMVGRRAVDLNLRVSRGALVAAVESSTSLSTTEADRVRAAVPHMLRLDEDLSEFWAMCERTKRLEWVARRRGGRILRSATVFEDLMKLLFTTNCSWAATKLMTRRLIDALGVKAPSGARAFPSPAKCAGQDEAFYRDVVRAGYRARSCIAIAAAFASGAVDDAWFTDESIDVDEMRERLLALSGIGPYAAGQAMRMLGHYKDLALDSWCRARLAELAGPRKPPADRTVERRYAAFHPYDGLALWMDLTAEWHGEGA
jgi:3-methyladenine DNA glycosylase/8-oxoguanine DNA glycosylase